jgi:hypothetical protein
MVANLPDQEVRDAFDHLRQEEGWPFVSLGQAIAAALVDTPGPIRPARLSQVIHGAVDLSGAAIVLVDHIEAIFAPSLAAHPVKLLAACARDRAIVAHWPGEFTPAGANGGIHRLTYAEPTHSEWFTHAAADLAVVYPHVDMWTRRVARTTAPSE